jgi:hypothetical protein
MAKHRCNDGGAFEDKQRNLLGRNIESRGSIGDDQADAGWWGEGAAVLVAKAAHASADGLLADLELEDVIATAYGHGRHFESDGDNTWAGNGGTWMLVEKRESRGRGRRWVGRNERLNSDYDLLPNQHVLEQDAKGISCRWCLVTSAALAYHG